MVRLGAIFVAICMVLIAGSIGAVLFLYFGLGGAEAAIVALTALTGLGLYNMVSSRLRDRGDFGGQIADLSRGGADLARQVAELNRRMAALEVKAEGAVVKALTLAQPLSAEIGELGSLVKQLAESVAAHDAALHSKTAVQPTPQSAPHADIEPSALPATPQALAVDFPEPEVTCISAAPAVSTNSPSATTGPFAGMDNAAVVGLIRDALDANRVDLYLQPIVTLPQRKVRYYEAMARLRTGEGETLLAADFIPPAEAAGLLPKLDNLMLFRCVQVVRRLLAKNREIGLFCNIATSTLVDPQMSAQFIEFMDANRALASSLFFEFTQAAYRAMGPMEYESLAALIDRGFRFSMDHLSDLRLEPRDLADRGFRFIKAPATLLLNRTGMAGTDIHPADFAGLLSRFGVELVAEKIESEGVVVDLLDYDVRYGQGYLFSPPRPIRPEILQGVADRNNVVTRETAAVVGSPRPQIDAMPAFLRAASDADLPASRISAIAQLARGVVARR